jgi:hypothetical protein
MDTEAVIFGTWENHGNSMNLMLSTQNNQKVGREVKPVFKYDNKHIMTADDVSSLKKVIDYKALGQVDGYKLEKA